MTDDTKIMPRDGGSNGNIEVLSPSARISSIELSPREPHLYDYLLILRKHQWLILSFLLAVVTIVSIATFRMKPVYTASAKMEIDQENTNILPFQGADSYDLRDGYLKITSRPSHVFSRVRPLRFSDHSKHEALAGNPEFSGSSWFRCHCLRDAGKSETPARNRCISWESNSQTHPEYTPDGSEL